MRIIAFCYLMLFASAAGAQYRFGVAAGAGITMFNVVKKNSNTSAHVVLTPTMEVNCLRQLRSPVSLGATLSYQRYSFDYSYSKHVAAGIRTDAVHTRADYLLLAPTVDVSIGKKQLVHLYVSPGAGYLLAGKQNTDDYLYGAQIVGSSYKSDGELKRFIFRLNLGLEEQVWNRANWSVLLNEGFTFMGTPVTTLPSSKTAVRPGYVYVQVGISRKYKETVVRK